MLRFDSFYASFFFLNLVHMLSIRNPIPTPKKKPAKKFMISSSTRMYPSFNNNFDKIPNAINKGEMISLFLIFITKNIAYLMLVDPVLLKWQLLHL